VLSARPGSLIVFIVVVVIGLMMFSDATPSERSWYRYENSHFEVYSDESQRVVRKLLEELENFRAAVLQVTNIKVPQSAPKLCVFIFTSDKEYFDLVGHGRVGGLPIWIDGVPHMALVSQGDARSRKRGIRHRYAHVLLAYNNASYPKWFEEGFALVYASTEFRKKNTEFTVGKALGGPFRSKISVPWRHIISEDFNPHSQSTPHPLSSTMYPSWLLTHYFLLGDNFRNAPLLAQYLALLGDGAPSAKAFEAIVGEPVDQFGNKLLKVYGRGQAKYMVFELQSPELDHQFTRRKATQDEVKQELEIFRGSFLDR